MSLVCLILRAWRSRFQEEALFLDFKSRVAHGCNMELTARSCDVAPHPGAEADPLSLKELLSRGAEMHLLH